MIAPLLGLSAVTFVTHALEQLFPESELMYRSCLQCPTVPPGPKNVAFVEGPVSEDNKIK